MTACTDLPLYTFSDAASSVYVEWGTSIFHDKSKDGAEVYFALSGTSNTFQIQARAPSGNFNLQAYFDGIATANNPVGSTISLGWSHNGHVPFILSGSQGGFWSNNPSPAWMHGLLPVIGDKPLRHICMPGSHDAGMTPVTGQNGHTALANAFNCQTQTQSIGQQLALGSRYIDLRPIITSGKYAAGHYSNTGVSVVNWQGANGEYLDDIISEVNAFTASNPELIIINLSHDANTDETPYEYFSQADYDGLLQKLSGINHLYTAQDPNADLTMLSLNDFIGNGQAAVIVIADIEDTKDGVNLGDYHGKGFYTYDQYNAYNNYSNSDTLDFMPSNQMSLLIWKKSNPDSQLFLLSWTMTQQVTDMAKTTSILDLAAEANDALWLDIWPGTNKNQYPNIIYIDRFESSAVTALAIAFNHAYASHTTSKSRRAMHKKRHSSPIF